MRQREVLSAAHPSKVINLDFDSVAMVVVNLTGSPIYVRVGSNEIPSEASADWLVPAAGTTCLPVVGRWFGVTFGDVAMVNDQGGDVTSGLLGTAIVLLLDNREIIPTFGSVSYLSLSLSDLSNGYVAFSGPTTSTIYDLSAWGGAILGLQPAVGSGQGVIALDASSDGVTFRAIGVYAFWPNVPVALTVPRTVRYLRVTLNATAISGEPAISGFYSVRATIAEITELTYTPTGSSITKSYTVASSSETSYTFVTVGLPAVSVGINNATGTRGQLIIEASQAAAGPWRLVAEREQSLASVNNSIYRSLGELDLFTRIRILDTGATGLTGTLTMSIPGKPDFTGMLQQIYSALGDTRQTPNVNQSIYHELDTIRLLAVAGNTLLSGISTLLSGIKVGTDELPTIRANVVAYLPELPTIRANTASISTSSSVLPTYQPNLAQLPGIKTDTGVLTAVTNRGAGPYVIQMAVVAGWNNAGLNLGAGGKIGLAHLSLYVAAGNQAGLIAIAYGTNGAPINAFYFQEPSPNWNAPVAFTVLNGPVIQYSSTYYAGINVPVGLDRLWIYAFAAGIATMTVVSG